MKEPHAETTLERSDDDPKGEVFILNEQKPHISRGVSFYGVCFILYLETFAREYGEIKNSVIFHVFLKNEVNSWAID